MPSYLPIIGLEIHVRLRTKSKLFCACANLQDDAPPQTAICSVCTGQPGALPALNAEAVRLGVRAGLALNCTIPDHSHFDRKSYFYPDLPKGYQISQYDFPISTNGHMKIDLPDGTLPRTHVRVGITRAHLEEDAAKNVHDASTISTLIDFNRAGTPLIEIVTEPDLRSPLEAKMLLQELQLLLRTIGVSDADMEKGHMRCDANISLLPIDEEHRPLQTGYNPKIEIKNLNSFRAVERALLFEIQRQRELLETGEIPHPATRGWNEHTGTTFEQRIKETNADYRYFPEPDLPALVLHEIAETQRRALPELPSAARQRLMDEWGFNAEQAQFFVEHEGWTAFVDAMMSEIGTWMEADDYTGLSGGDLLAANKTRLAKLAGGWLTSKLAGLLSTKNMTLKTADIRAENMAEFLHLVDQGIVNSTNAQKLLELLLDTRKNPKSLVMEHDLGQMRDPHVIREHVTRLIEAHPDQANQIRQGKAQTIQWFVGNIMKATGGRVDPALAEVELRKQLNLTD